MGWFPLCIDLRGAKVLLVGRGAELEKKVKKLTPFGAELRIMDRISEEDLDPGPALVLAAGLDREEMERISSLCRERGIPVNAADETELCSFYFPSLITRGDLTVSITTGGKSPAAAALLRQRIEEQIPDRMEEILDWGAEIRIGLKESWPDGPLRRKLLRRIMAEAMEKNRPLTKTELDEIYRETGVRL